MNLAVVIPMVLFPIIGFALGADYQDAKHSGDEEKIKHTKVVIAVVAVIMAAVGRELAIHLW